MQAIIHIGLPKTDTSSIQAVLRMNQTALGCRRVGRVRDRARTVEEAHKNIAALAKMFTSVFSKVTYLLYLRNQETLAVSRYSERIKHGHSVKMTEFLRQEFFPDRETLFTNAAKNNPTLGNLELNNRTLAAMTDLVIQQKIGRIRTVPLHERRRAFVKPDTTLALSNDNNSAGVVVPEPPQPISALTYWARQIKNLIQN